MRLAVGMLLAFSISLNVVLAVVPGDAPHVSSTDGDQETSEGHMQLMLGSYEVQATNASFDGWGHPALATSPSYFDEDQRFRLTNRAAEAAGGDPSYCLIIQTVIPMGTTNPEVTWEAVSCHTSRNSVFVQDYLNEWYASFFTPERATVFGPGYSLNVREGTPVEMNVTGTFHSTVGYADDATSYVQRVPIDFRANITWTYFPDVPWHRAV